VPTLVEVLDRAKITAAPDPDIEGLDIPVLCGPQRQGDVFIRPAKDGEITSEGDLIPAKGVMVIRGEATNNAHILHGDGPCLWTTDVNGPTMALGGLTVPDGCEAWLIHPDEHGANGIGPGKYILTGKREQADEIRRVSD